MSIGEVHGHRVRVVAVSDGWEQPPISSAAEHVLSPDAPSTVWRFTSTPAFSLAWAASLPVAGGGLAWYAALHCFVC